MSNYIPLHIHSHFSLLDGLSKPDQIADRIVEIGSDGCALTDHGTISGSIKFVEAMQKVDKKPVLGCELYISNQSANIKEESNRKLIHLPILAKNTKGWQQLIKIVSESNKEEHFYYKPRLSLPQLQKFLDGNIIGFSGHLGSHVAQYIEEYGFDGGVRAANVLQEIFGKDNFYLEVQLMDHVLNPKQKEITDIIRKIGKKLDIPCIATPDAHYAKKEDAEDQRILLCTSMHTTMQEGMKPDFMLNTFFKSSQYYIPSNQDMLEFGHTQEELDNTRKIFDQIEEYQILHSPILPKFNVESEFEYLTELCREGWKELLLNKITEEEKEVYTERIKRELRVIEEADLAGYFLIIHDIVDYCNKNKWLMSAGRGSAAGCLISYLLGITRVDPIKHNLLFERFYDESRKGALPDIDIDVPIKNREDIFKYIQDKYGEENVAQITTYQSMKGAKALKEVFRAYGKISFDDANLISKNIIPEHKITDELEQIKQAGGEPSIIMWCLENMPDRFKDWVTLEDGEIVGEYAEEFKQAIRLEGTYTTQSKHAAGVVIAPSYIGGYCPLLLDKHKKEIAGFVLEDLEKVGLVKLDLLGLNFLDKMMLVKNLAEKNGGDFDIDIRRHDFKDEETWDLIAAGNTKGCFQLESQLGQAYAKKLEPHRIEHLSALMALLRPGSLEAKLEDGKSITEHYIMRKHGVEEVSYLHEALQPILKDTYGMMIYQESSMKIANQIAGMSLVDTDKYIRKGIGKKKADLIAKAKDLFINGCEEQAIITKEDAELIFGWIESSSRYSFNASHSYSYAYNCYLSAYAKVHFPKEFFTAYLRYAREKIKPLQEIYELVNNAKSMDIYVMPPDIRKKNVQFDLIDGQIYFGLSDIKGVGESMVHKILESIEGVELNWFNFLYKVSDSIHKDAVEGLINSGALDSFNKPRKAMSFEYGIYNKLTKREKSWLINNADTDNLLENLQLLHRAGSGKEAGCANINRLNKVDTLIESIHSPPYPLEDQPHQIAQVENQLLGISLTYNSLDGCNNKYKANCNCEEFLSGYNTRSNYVTIAGEVQDVRNTSIKNGPSKGLQMAFIQIGDHTGSINGICWPETWLDLQHTIQKNNRLLFTGQRDKNKGSLIIAEVEQL